jgi:hypothetical protein
VTRLDEFSIIEWLFTLSSFLEITLVSHIFWATLFPYTQRLCINFVKNGMGYIFQKLEWKNGIVKIFYIYLVTLAFLILFLYSGGIKTISLANVLHYIEPRL